MTKNVRNLIIICAAVYIAAYIGRLSYAASMVGIMEATGASKPDAGLVSTFFYFTYGCGQLVNAFLCKYYKPRQMVAGVLIFSAAANVAAGLVQDVTVIKYIWLLNGAAQSVLWCTLIELISNKVPQEHRRRAIFAMSITVAAGTTTIYSLAALCVAAKRPFLTFFIAAAIVLAAALAWLYVTRVLPQMPTVRNTAPAAGGEKKSRAPITAAALAPFAVYGVLAIGNGFMKDTMVTWVPSLLYDEFGMPSSFSTLITLVLPLLSFFGSTIALALHRKIASYTVMKSILFFGSAAAFAGVYLSYLYRFMAGTILFAVANAIMMAAVNNIITSMIPLERGSGAGLFAGVMDAFCYVGSTASGFLPGVIIESLGFGALLGGLPIFAVSLAAFAVIVTLIGRRAKKT